MTMNNDNNPFKLKVLTGDKTIKQDIKLGNEDLLSSMDKKAKRKRRLNEIDEINVRTKKVKTFGPIVINELSKAFIHEQSQVYFPTWFTQFPTVRLKIVSQETNSNRNQDCKELNTCTSDKIDDVAAAKAITNCSSTYKGIKKCEIKLERIDQSQKYSNSNGTNNLDLLKKKPEKFKAITEPLLILNQLNEVKESCIKNKEDTALTELRIQQFSKPVVRLKLLDENEINQLKFSLLKNGKNGLAQIQVTTKLTIISSMEPIFRLRKIMEAININKINDQQIENGNNIQTLCLTSGQPEITVQRRRGRPKSDFNEESSDSEISIYGKSSSESENIIKKELTESETIIYKDLDPSVNEKIQKRGRGRPRKTIEEEKICDNELEENEINFCDTKLVDERMEMNAFNDIPRILSDNDQVCDESTTENTAHVKIFKNKQIPQSSNSVKIARKLLKTARKCKNEDTTKRKYQRKKNCQNDDLEESIIVTTPASPAKIDECKIKRKYRKKKNGDNDDQKKMMIKKNRPMDESPLVSPVKIDEIIGFKISKTSKRKIRCKKCENCLRPNCGKCIFCLDKTKYGGQNILKQCCKNKKCLFRERTSVKLKPQLTTFTLTPKLEQLMKSQKPFMQDRPCWKLPLKPDQCLQCANDCKYGLMDEILCRFYLFRRLKFTEDEILKPIGFADANATSKDDFNLFLPRPKKPADIDRETSLFILNNVGDHFCSLVKQEKLIRERVITKETVLKRAIQGIREMCDVCETTIFNFHFSCGTCGFGICIDCYEDNDSLWMMCAHNTSHVKDELMITQTIPGDILWEMNDLTHKICSENGVSMRCTCVNAENKLKLNKENSICKQSLMDQQYKKQQDDCICDENALPNENKIESDRRPLTALTTIINCVIDNFFNGTTVDAKRRQHFADKYPETMNGGKDYSNRIFTLTESRALFPNVPHSWLCEGRLLWLHDPHHNENVPLFQEIWKRGQPVLVSNVHDHLDISLWHPSSFSRDFGELKNDLIDTVSGAMLYDEPMKNFWDGFEDPDKRLKDENERPRLLKLKDWPPGDDFSVILPSRFTDLMKALPLPDYTHRDGKLNLTARLPGYFVPPDLGPKMYIAYGSTQYPSQGTTNLHLDMSDAVNVMVYVGMRKDETQKAHIEEAFHAVCEAGCDILARKRVRQKGVQLGAIWHIFKAKDAPKIRTLLNTLAREKGEILDEKSDPIHDQRWYLDSALRQRLYTEYAVDGCAIAQCEGDAVFIPAGAPHQVRNLHSCIKVAEDFVTPENIGHCIKLTQEFRHLSKSHTNHEDKLQIKNIAYHSIKDALSVVMATKK